MTFEKHLRSVSRAASEMAWHIEEVLSSILWYIVSWKMLSRFCPARFGVLFCIVVIGCRYKLKQLERVESGARFLTGDVFKFDFACRRSVAVSCVLCRVTLCILLWCRICSVCTRGSSVAYQNIYAPPRSRTSLYRCTFISLCVSVERSCWPCIRWCGTYGFGEQGQCILA